MPNNIEVGQKYNSIYSPNKHVTIEALDNSELFAWCVPFENESLLWLDSSMQGLWIPISVIATHWKLM